MKKPMKTPAKMKKPAAKSAPKKALQSEDVELKTELPDPEMAEPPEHEVEHAVKTLADAHKIKSDEKMMPHVKKHIDKKMKSLSELKKLGYKKSSEEAE